MRTLAAQSSPVGPGHLQLAYPPGRVSPYQAVGHPDHAPGLNPGPVSVAVSLVLAAPPYLHPYSLLVMATAHRPPTQLTFPDAQPLMLLVSFTQSKDR
jgi:hypothetical protein